MLGHAARRACARGVVLALCAVPSVLAGAGAAGAATTATPKLYWTDSVTRIVGRANLDGTGANSAFLDVIGGLEPSPVGLAVDGQDIYWTNESGTIGRANLDRQEQVPVDVPNVDSRWIALDSQHIYWTEAGGVIGRADLNPGSPFGSTGVNWNFITGAADPGGIAVDGQHIYWANTSTSSIGRANLDGSGVNESFITGAYGAEGVAVDGQHVYWTNEGGTIGRANLDGTGVNESFIADDSEPLAIAVDSQHIYWTNQFTGDGLGSIGEANLDGTGVNEDLIGRIDPLGLALSVPILSISPAAPPTFAASPQGGGSTQTLTLANTGQQNLSIYGASLTGPNAGDFKIDSSSCAGPVAPGASCTVVVDFSSIAAGTRTAGLRILSNDFADSPTEIPLTGTGVQPPTSLRSLLAYLHRAAPPAGSRS